MTDLPIIYIFQLTRPPPSQSAPPGPPCFHASAPPGPPCFRDAPSFTALCLRTLAPLQFGQIHLASWTHIHFAIWTNTFVKIGQIHLASLDKFILQFGQIHFAIWKNKFCNLEKYILQFGQIHVSKLD